MPTTHWACALPSEWSSCVIASLGRARRWQAGERTESSGSSRGARLGPVDRRPAQAHNPTIVVAPPAAGTRKKEVSCADASVRPH